MTKLHWIVVKDTTGASDWAKNAFILGALHYRTSSKYRSKHLTRGWWWWWWCLSSGQRLPNWWDGRQNETSISFTYCSQLINCLPARCLCSGRRRVASSARSPPEMKRRKWFEKRTKSSSSRTFIQLQNSIFSRFPRITWRMQRVWIKVTPLWLLNSWTLEKWQCRTSSLSPDKSILHSLILNCGWDFIGHRSSLSLIFISISSIRPRPSQGCPSTSASSTQGRGGSDPLLGSSTASCPSSLKDPLLRQNWRKTKK